MKYLFEDPSAGPGVERQGVLFSQDYDDMDKESDFGEESSDSQAVSSPSDASEGEDQATEMTPELEA